MAAIGDRIYRRYAEAVFAWAQGVGQVEEVQAELEQAVSLLAAQAPLRARLEHPEVPLTRKWEAVETALGGWARPPLVNLVKLLVRRGRVVGLPTLARHFADLADQARGLVRARVSTAVPLAPQQEARLRRALERLTGGRVQMEGEVNPELLAGGQVRIGDRLVDGSAHTALVRLRERLEGLR